MKGLSERSLLLLLAAVQFTHIMDFMVMMPLGPQLMRELAIGPASFSHIVAAYSISAGVIGLLAAPFIDRFQRKKLLLVTYGGFVLGTLAVALSHSAGALLVSRAICGAFGGVSGSLVLAVVGDIVPPERRASGMGIIMTAFSFAAAIGVPTGLFLAQKFVWETPFFLLAGLSALSWLLIFHFLPAPNKAAPVDHAAQRASFIGLLKDGNAGRALIFMAALVLGHFAIIPFLSPYLVKNVGLAENHLSLIYLIGGVCTVVTSPLVGKLADKLGRFQVFAVLAVVASAVTWSITHGGRKPLWLILLEAACFFIFASGRFVPAQAMMSLAVPASQRGAFMSLTSCTRDFTAGASSAVIGLIVDDKTPDGSLRHVEWLGWIAVGAAALSIWLASRVRAVDSGAKA